MPVLHGLLLLSAIILGIVFYARKQIGDETMRVQTWDLSVQPCDGGGACAPAEGAGSRSEQVHSINCTLANARDYSGWASSGESNICLLNGASAMFERKANDALFSWIDITLYTILSQMVLGGLTLSYSIDLFGSQRTALRGATFVLGVSCAFVLLTHNVWYVPISNLFVGIGGILLGIFYLGLVQTHSDGADAEVWGQCTRITAHALSLPYLGVAVLALNGISQTGLFGTCFVSLFASAFMLLGAKNLQIAAADGEAVTTRAHVQTKAVTNIIVLAAWTAAIPAIITTSMAAQGLTISENKTGFTQRAWAVSALALFIIHYILVLIIHTVDASSKRLKLSASAADHWRLAEDLQTVCLRTGIVMSILIGSLSAL